MFLAFNNLLLWNYECDKTGKTTKITRNARISEPESE